MLATMQIAEEFHHRLNETSDTNDSDGAPVCLKMCRTCQTCDSVRVLDMCHTLSQVNTDHACICSQYQNFLEKNWLLCGTIKLHFSHLTTYYT